MNRKAVLPTMLLAIALPVIAQTPSQAGKPAAAPAQAANPGQARADALFARWDADKDRMLSQAEFEAGWTALQRAAMLELQLRKQFRELDRNADNALDAGEYAQLELVKRAGQAAPPLSRFDASKDQRLQFVEYVAAVAALSAAQKQPPAADRK